MESPVLGLSLVEFRDWLPPLAIAVVSFVLLRRAYRKPKKSARAARTSRRGTVPGRGAAAHLSAGAEHPANLDRLEVQLHEVGRHWTAVIDSKIVILRHLLDDIDARIARLEILRADDLAVAKPEVDAPSAGAPVTPPDQNDPRTIATELLERISGHDQGAFSSSLIDAPAE
jgi:hypothetical protein